MEDFEHVYEQNKDFVFRVVYKMVQNQQIAEDLVQDTFIRVFEKREKFQAKSTLKTWIFRIATHITLSYLAREKTRNNARFIWPFQHDDFSQEIESSVDVDQLKKWLKEVTPSYRICLILKETEDLSYQDIAQTLGININTVRSRINRAKKQLVTLSRRRIK